MLAIGGDPAHVVMPRSSCCILTWLWVASRSPRSDWPLTIKSGLLPGRICVQV